MQTIYYEYDDEREMKILPTSHTFGATIYKRDGVFLYEAGKPDYQPVNLSWAGR